MRVAELHGWDVSAAEARQIQEDLRRRIDLTDRIDLDAVSLVAGVDNAYSRENGDYTAHAVIVVMRLPALDIVETRFASLPVTFPYVPGLLTFREAPAVLAAARQVTSEPDVVLFDGQGYAHPRRMGLAAHLSLVLDRPTIGCAKSRLTGRYAEPADEPGSASPLVDRGEVVGAAVRTRPGHSPLFVSPGNGLSIDTAVQVVLACCRDNHFMPEPTRQAHDLVTDYKRSLKDG